MCGIVGFTGKEQAAPILLEGLSKLEYRGYDSAGIAVRDGDRDVDIVKAKGRLKILAEKTNDGKAVIGSCGIGHTRWATHGEPSENNAHPHRSDDGNIVAVHNGIIENYQELKEKLVRKGYTFYSDTDTEVAVKLIDKYYLMSNNSMLVKLLKWIGAILVLIIVLIIVNNLFAIKSGTGSWEVRFDDFLAGYKAWKDNILFGNGYDTMDAINWHMSAIRAYNTGYSSGIFSILAQGGIFLIINYIIGFIGYIKYSISLHRFELCAMIIIIFIILVTSIFQYTFIMMIILAYGYALLTLEIAKSLRK